MWRERLFLATMGMSLPTCCRSTHGRHNRLTHHGPVWPTKSQVDCGSDGLLRQELPAVHPKVFSLVAMTAHGREGEFPPVPQSWRRQPQQFLRKTALWQHAVRVLPANCSPSLFLRPGRSKVRSTLKSAGRSTEARRPKRPLADCVESGSNAITYRPFSNEGT